MACRCRHCGLSARAAFPEDVTAPVRYGPRLAATAIYLQNAHFLPEERLTQILRDLFGVSLCPGTLNNLRRRAAEAREPLVERIREHLIRCPGVKHLDETGFRVGGRGQWLHGLSHQLLTYYRISEKRGGVLAGLRGILVHDHWAPYFQVPDGLHALCNALPLYELESLVKIDGEAWAGRIQRFLRAAKRVAERARKRGGVVPQMLKRMESRYDELVQEALDYPSGLPPLPTGRRGRQKRRPGHNLALRLERRRAWVLLFLFDWSVPFTNNLGERDLCMMKLLMKISGGFRSLQGAREFVTLRSVLSTARKQGLKPIETLIEGPAALLKRVGLAPSLPPAGSRRGGFRLQAGQFGLHLTELGLQTSPLRLPVQQSGLALGALPLHDPASAPAWPEPAAGSLRPRLPESTSSYAFSAQKSRAPPPADPSPVPKVPRQLLVFLVCNVYSLAHGSVLVDLHRTFSRDSRSMPSVS